MAEAMGKRGEQELPACRGHHPHLGSFGTCDKNVRTIALGATNSWFASQLTVFSLPRAEEPLTQAVRDDAGSECNVLPVYDETTDWERPVRRLRKEPPLDLIAIDNLPSLLPEEASTDFSAALLPQLMALGPGLTDPASPWDRCLDRFREVCQPQALTAADAGEGGRD